jgi:hypothetical protein
MTPLERRCRRWLFTYPTEYRQEHEAEIMGTLLEAAAPGQAHVSMREGAALLAGGLRTRARLAARSPLQLWADGLRLGALLLLMWPCAGLAALLLWFSPIGGARGSIGHPDLVQLEVAVLAVGVAALARASFRIGLVVVVALVLLQQLMWATSPGVVPLERVRFVWVIFGSIVAAFAWHPALRPVSRPWSWRVVAVLLAAVALWVVCLTALDVVYQHLPSALNHLVRPALIVVPAAVLIFLAAVASDPRPALAATVYVAADVLDHVQTLVSVQIAYFPWAQYQFETIVSVLVAAGALAVTILSARATAGRA